MKDYITIYQNDSCNRSISVSTRERHQLNSL